MYKQKSLKNSAILLALVAATQTSAAGNFFIKAGLRAFWTGKTKTNIKDLPALLKGAKLFADDKNKTKLNAAYTSATTAAGTPATTPLQTLQATTGNDAAIKAAKDTFFAAVNGGDTSIPADDLIRAIDIRASGLIALLVNSDSKDSSFTDLDSQRNFADYIAMSLSAGFLFSLSSDDFWKLGLEAKATWAPWGTQNITTKNKEDAAIRLVSNFKFSVDAIAAFGPGYIGVGLGGQQVSAKANDTLKTGVKTIITKDLDETLASKMFLGLNLKIGVNFPISGILGGYAEVGNFMPFGKMDVKKDNLKSKEEGKEAQFQLAKFNPFIEAGLRITF